MDILFDERLELEDSDPKRRNRLQMQTLDVTSAWDNDQLFSPKSEIENPLPNEKKQSKTLLTKFGYNKRIINQSEKTQKMLN